MTIFQGLGFGCFKLVIKQPGETEFHCDSDSDNQEECEGNAILDDGTLATWCGEDHYLGDANFFVKFSVFTEGVE